MEYIGKYEEGLLIKAQKYNISIKYQDNQIDWLNLIDAIECREALFRKAQQLNIDFEEYEDDPIMIKQMIEEEKNADSAYKRELINYYYSTRGC